MERVRGGAFLGRTLGLSGRRHGRWSGRDGQPPAHSEERRAEGPLPSVLELKEGTLGCRPRSEARCPASECKLPFALRLTAFQRIVGVSRAGAGRVRAAPRRIDDRVGKARRPSSVGSPMARLAGGARTRSRSFAPGSRAHEFQGRARVDPGRASAAALEGEGPWRSPPATGSWPRPTGHRGPRQRASWSLPPRKGDSGLAAAEPTSRVGSPWQAPKNLYVRP